MVFFPLSVVRSLERNCPERIGFLAYYSWPFAARGDRGIDDSSLGATVHLLLISTGRPFLSVFLPPQTSPTILSVRRC